MRSAALVVGLALVAGCAHRPPTTSPPGGPAASSAPAAPAPPRRILIDDFGDVAAWSVHPADGVEASVSADRGAMRIDVHFTRGTGYAVVRRAVSLDLPADYAFRFRLHGELPPNHLEMKLVDATDKNVWWHVRRDLAWPRDWTSLASRKRQIGFAWGPAGGGEIRRVAFLEFAISAGEGGRGSVWLDDLVLESVPPDSTAPRPLATASSERPDRRAAHAVDSDTLTSWASIPGDSAQALTLDLGRVREFGGLSIEWQPGGPPPSYAIDLSLDGATWTTRHEVALSNGGLDAVYLPESEARFVRVRATGQRRGRVLAVREVALQPLEWSSTPEAFVSALARNAPRGVWPRAYLGEQGAWAVVGADGAREEALLGEDGALETGRRRFSIEPFLFLDGRLVTWADVKALRSLADDRLPMPSVTWPVDSLSFSISAFATSDTARPLVYARYRLRNTGDRPRHVTLYLAIRPYQVNPPWQGLAASGGVAPIHRVAREGGVVWVDGQAVLASLGRPSGFGATELAAGEIVEHLRGGNLPTRDRAEDPQGFASAALAYRIELAALGEREIDLVVPLRPSARAPDTSAVDAQALERRVAAEWRAKLDRVRIELPPSGTEALRTLEAQIGWILVNRDGGSIQPGSRSYDRSWIRDGSLTSTALLRLGHPQVVRDFIEWFAPFQDPNGKVPCCASERGPDPVTENDSHGQFVYLVAEYHRYTGDFGLARRMWPRVQRAIAHMDSQRASRRTTEWRTPERRQFFGLLQPSISHEGYPNPMHSYWDDFFGYRGYVDAVYLAQALGAEEARQRIAAQRDTFAADLAASIALAMKIHKVNYIPGCAELGDFDATSTTVALSPTDFADRLPEAAVRRTFDRYWEFFTDRRDGKKPWDGFTPYETRVIGSFVRLGARERAHQAVAFFLAHRLPAEWRQWPEVSYHDPRAPKFLGDLPHTWVGSDFVRSMLDMLAYERSRDSTLVLASGVPLEWCAGEGVRVRELRTTYGRLSYTLRDSGGAIEMRIEAGVRVPPGGIEVRPPSAGPLRSVEVDGTRQPVDASRAVVVRRLPARLLFR